MEVLKEYNVKSFADRKNVGIWVGNKDNPKKILICVVLALSALAIAYLISWNIYILAKLNNKKYYSK